MKISIHRALAQVKTTEDRIERLLDQSMFISSTGGTSGLASDGRRVEDVEKSIKSDYDSLKDLLENYRELKLSITRSNSGITKDTRCIAYADPPKQMTVAEVIVYQAAIIPLYRRVVDKLTAQYNRVLREVESYNQRVHSEAEMSVVSTAGNRDNAQKYSVDEVKLLIDLYEKSRLMTLVDPLNLKQVIQDHSDSLDRDIEWADATLSESNALTTIEVNM